VKGHSEAAGVYFASVVSYTSKKFIFSLTGFHLQQSQPFKLPLCGQCYNFVTSVTL